MTRHLRFPISTPLAKLYHLFLWSRSKRLDLLVIIKHVNPSVRASLLLLEDSVTFPIDSFNFVLGSLSTSPALIPQFTTLSSSCRERPRTRSNCDVEPYVEICVAAADAVSAFPGLGRGCPSISTCRHQGKCRGSRLGDHRW